MKNINWKKIGLQIANGFLHVITGGLAALQTKVSDALKKIN